jgi:ribonuclease HI
MSEYILNFDGSISKNPGGIAACGFVFKKDGVKYDSTSYIIGEGPYSNNYAEFYGAYLGLQYIYFIAQPKDKIFVRGDSQLAINVLAHKWKSDPLKLYYPAYEKADNVTKALRKMGCYVDFSWVPRKQNMEADELSKYNRK